MGINHLLKRGSNIDVVTNTIMNVTNECKNYGIKSIFVSGLKNRNRLYSDFINALRNALKLEWVKYGYDFIKNSNILPDNL